MEARIRKRDGFLFLFCIFAVIQLHGHFVQSQATYYIYPCSSYTSWQTYYSNWYQMYPPYAYHGMYPFGPSFCDQNATSANKSVAFNIGTTFPFNYYGSVYKSFLVSAMGYIMLNETVYRAGYNLPSYYPSPNQLFPIQGAVDPPFISPMYSYYYFPSGADPSAVNWRVLNPKGETGSNQVIQQGMLDQLTKDIKAATLNSMYFQAQWGVIITYYNMTTATSPYCNPSTNFFADTCPRNTFQVAIATDGTNSYVIYNYFNITTVGGINQACDPFSYSPNSTANPLCQPAQMGFNSGFARGFTTLPYVNTTEMVDMDMLSGTNVTGRWVYRVSGDVVQHGGCTNDTSLGSSGRWPLSIFPMFGPMFGGNIVNVSGPCFLKNADVRCKFGNVVSKAYNWGDMMQVMCVQPMLYEVGPVNLSVSVDGGQNYYFSAIYTVVQQERLTVADGVVSAVSNNNNWLNPYTITLTWNPANLTTEWGNVVTIQLMGYYQKSWQVIYTFVFESTNTGTYTFTYSSNMCYNQNNHQICSKYALGAFRVSLSNWQWDYNNPIALWSAPVPLGWFMQSQVYYDEGGWWSHDNCRNWYSTNTMEITHLVACPCTLNQSYVDMSFIQSTDCNLNNYASVGGCPRNQGAMACFDSINITAQGSNTRCCYDKYGNLLYTGDSVNGSISQSSAPSGLYPYNNNPYIPSISTWENDLLPYYYCCIWQNNPYDCFNIYMVNRPTQDCKNYVPPGRATAYGDPHFITMDGTAYAFNGWGEFWLLQINNAQVAGGTTTFYLQGRFQQPSNYTYPFTVRATVMTAAAMQVNGGTVVTVMSNLYGSTEHLFVYVNSTLLNFTYPGQAWQQFPDFYVVNNDLTGSYSNFSILFRIGIGVNVAWQTGVMQMFVTIPANFKGNTGGLFGYWNGNPLDDLMPSGSSSTPVSSTDPQSVYNAFGMSWIVQESQSIFTYVYRSNLNYQYYRNSWFTPWFNLTVPPGSPANIGTAQSICYGDTACEYDYLVTGNQTIAQETHAITMWDTQMRQMGQMKYSCGWLPVADSTKNLPVSYLVGSQVTITGCMSGFMLENYNIESYTCQQSGSTSTAVWSSTVQIYCYYLNGQPPPAVQAAIAVPICVVSTTAIILLIIFLCRRKERKARRAARKERRTERHNGSNPETQPLQSSSAIGLTAGPMYHTNDSHTDPAQQEDHLVSETKEQVDSVPMTKAEKQYTGIVTGVLSDSYVQQASRSNTPSKMSVETGVSHVTNGRNDGMIDPVVAPPRSRTPSQGYPSRPGSRAGVMYTPDPTRNVELTLTVKPAMAGPVPYQPAPYQPGRQSPYQTAPYQPSRQSPYQTGRQSPYESRAGDNYYTRRYAPGPGSEYDNDSEV